MQRCFTNILSMDVKGTAKFYEQLLGMKRHFDSDWFIILTHDNIKGLELGILQQGHELAPNVAKTAPSGVMITFVVDDCDTVYKKAQALNAKIIEAPRDMPYGQRRMLLEDYDGTLIDISAPTAPIIET